MARLVEDRWRFVVFCLILPTSSVKQGEKARRPADSTNSLSMNGRLFTYGVHVIRFGAGPRSVLA